MEFTQDRAYTKAESVGDRMQKQNHYKRAFELYEHYAATIEKETDAIVEAAADMIVTEAKAKCPVDFGDLQASIHHDIKKSDGVIECEIIADAANPMSGECYGDFVEYGTGIYRVTGDGRQTPWRYKDRRGNWHTTRGQKPQPFFRPAIRKVLPELRKKLKALVLEVKP